MNGWVKLHRSMLNWEWFDNPKMAHFFTYCILKASHNDYRWRGKKLDAGQFPMGLNTASAETGLSVRSIRTCINKLKSTNELTIETSPQGSIITLLNWNKYQTETNEPTINRQSNDNQTTTTKKVKKVKKVKNNKTCVKKSFMDDIFHDVISHLNSVTGSRLKPQNSPHQKLIEFWIDKGYRIEDFKHVIDVKFQEWGDNPKMVKYTKRPATLFGKSHFEDYLSQELERNVEDDVFDYLSGLEQEMREKQGDRKNGNEQGGNKSASSATQ